MKVLVTGANGFIGKNLIAELAMRPDVDIMTFTRDDDMPELSRKATQADFIFHLAGVNRPDDVKEFQSGNQDLTHHLCSAVSASTKQIPVLFTSSSQAELDNPYGLSKRGAERALQDLENTSKARVCIFRLPNVFGRWARPNYNSVVATFCHNIARNLPIRIDNPAAPVSLVYVDDVTRRFITVMDATPSKGGFFKVQPEYAITVGELAALIQAFSKGYSPELSDQAEPTLEYALYKTYLSYLPQAADAQ